VVQFCRHDGSYSTVSQRSLHCTHLDPLEIEQVDVLLHFVQRQRDLDLRVGRVDRQHRPGLLAAAAFARAAVQVLRLDVGVVVVVGFVDGAALRVCKSREE
jgi:hypothetical protein